MPGGNHEKLTRTIEVFRPGTFTPMNGVPVTFSADDLRALAADYDFAQPAPAVVGHPKTDDPAFGWATGFTFDEDGQRLTAEIGEIDPAFAEAVEAGRYKKISLSLFTPDAPNNPKPGKWYPKHVGFLGAAAPAVSGLKPVQFAEDETGTVTFEFSDVSAFRDVAGLFRSLREWMIEKFGTETADKAVPGWTIGWIEASASPEQPPTGAFFAAPSSTPEKTMDPKKLAADQVALKAREEALNERERAANHTDNIAFAEKLVNERRLLPALKDKVIGLLDSLSPLGGAQLEVSFAEGNETKTSGALDLVKSVLSGQPPVVSFGAHDLGRNEDAAVADFAMPEGAKADPASAELHAKAIAWQAAHPGTEYMAAVAAVKS